MEKIHPAFEKAATALFGHPLVESGLNVRSGHNFNVAIVRFESVIALAAVEQDVAQIRLVFGKDDLKSLVDVEGVNAADHPGRALDQVGVGLQHVVRFTGTEEHRNANWNICRLHVGAIFERHHFVLIRFSVEILVNQFPVIEISCRDVPVTDLMTGIAVTKYPFLRNVCRTGPNADRSIILVE